MLTIIPSRIQAEWRVSSIWTSPSDGPSVFLYRKLRTIYIFIDCRRGGLVKWEKTFESILHQRVRRSWRLIKPQLCTLLYQSGSQKHDGDNALEYVLHSWSIEIGTKTKKKLVRLIPRAAYIYFSGFDYTCTRLTGDSIRRCSTSQTWDLGA